MAYAVLILATCIWGTVLYRNFSKKNRRGGNGRK